MRCTASSSAAPASAAFTCRRARPCMHCSRRGQRDRVPDDRLDGLVALVTGGGRGIGANIARELTAAGARVAVSARSRDQVESVAREIDGLAVVADVSEPDSVEAMVGEVETTLGP